MAKTEMSPEDKDLYIDILEDHLIAAAKEALVPSAVRNDVQPSLANVIHVKPSQRQLDQE